MTSSIESKGGPEHGAAPAAWLGKSGASAGASRLRAVIFGAKGARFLTTAGAGGAGGVSSWGLANIDLLSGSFHLP